MKPDDLCTLPLLWLMTTVINEWLLSHFFLLRTSTPAIHMEAHTENSHVHTLMSLHLTLKCSHRHMRVCTAHPHPDMQLEDQILTTIQQNLGLPANRVSNSSALLIEQNCLRSPVHSCEENARQIKGPYDPSFAKAGSSCLPGTMTWADAAAAPAGILFDSPLRGQSSTTEDNLHSLE